MSRSRSRAKSQVSGSLRLAQIASFTSGSFHRYDSQLKKRHGRDSNLDGPCELLVIPAEYSGEATTTQAERLERTVVYSCLYTATEPILRRKANEAEPLLIKLSWIPGISPIALLLALLQGNIHLDHKRI